MDIVKQGLFLLKGLPLWFWIIAPSLLFMFFTYSITRNRGTAIIMSIVAAALISLTVSFQQWEVYLSNHFVGAFDKQGIPNEITQSGWLLLIEAWPMWLVPTVYGFFIGGLLLFVVSYGLFYKKNPTNLLQKKQRRSNIQTVNHGEISIAVENQLEIQKLQKQLKQSQAQLNKYSGKPTLQENKELKQLTEKNQQLSTQVETLKKDLRLSRELIEELLKDHYKESNAK